MYFYLGHGAGSIYLPEALILNQKTMNESKNKQNVIAPPRTSLFLFGCSSLKQFFDQQSSQLHKVREKQGIPLALMMAQEKLIVGALWDVTDRDVDRMLVKIVENLIAAGNKEIEIPDILIQVQSVCRFSHLNGGAFVCYGLPIKFAQC